MRDSHYFLNEALKQAKLAEAKNEVPVGCVIVHEGKVIARTHNLREEKQDPLCHAEMLAIQKAAKKLGSWRLEGCEIFVTLEPCPMCAAALQQARIEKAWYGATDPKAGAVSLGLPLHNNAKLNHRYEMNYVESKECGEILSAFFKRKRLEKKEA